MKQIDVKLTLLYFYFYFYLYFTYLLTWLIKSLKLAKIPNNIISAIENLAESWYTILHLNSSNETTVSDLIKII